MSKLAEALAYHVKRLRKEHGISQEELATKLETTRQSIGRYESGSGKASFETISKMAQIFKVDETELTTDPNQYEFYSAAIKMFSEGMVRGIDRDNALIAKGIKNRARYESQDGAIIEFTYFVDEFKSEAEAVEHHKESRRLKQIAQDRKKK